jgi:AmiR/NasT family two-component response regulator
MASRRPGYDASMNERRLRVLIADERQTRLDHIGAVVEALGHEVIAHEVEVEHVGRATVEHQPDLAIVALHQNSEQALHLIAEIVHEATCCVVALAEDADDEFVAAAAERGVFAHLDSLDHGELKGGIAVAIQRYEEYRGLLAAFRRRARIEQAKGILMERHDVDDREAFERIRRQARSEQRKLMTVVDEILGARRPRPSAPA